MSRAYLYAVGVATLVLGLPLAPGAAAAQPPAPTLTSNPPNLSPSSSATFAFSDTDLTVTFQCKIDGGTFSLCLSPVTYSGLGDGPHTFGVKAVDPLLNESTVTSHSWTVDTTPPPAPTIGSKPANPTNATTASFSFSDSEAGVRFHCRLDNGLNPSCTSPKTYSGLGVGSHTFVVHAIDAAGNRSATSYTWVIDTTPPTITLTKKPTDPSADPNPYFSFSANEAVKGYECKLNGASFAPCTSPVIYGPLSSAKFTFTVQATDLVGNTGSTNYTWTLDLAAPIATILSGPASSTNQASATFTFSSNKGGSSFQCQLDGGSFASCTSPKSYPSLADSVHTFVVKASDALHKGPPSPPYTWSVDTVAPETTITMTPDPVSASASATFGFTSSEAGSSFACSLDREAFTACSSPRTYDGLADGQHTVQVRAADLAGNVDPTPASFAWQVASLAPPDLTAPGNVRRVTRTVGYGVLQMTWAPPADGDFDHVKILVSRSPKKAARTVVYTGRGRRYADRHFKNGTYYRFKIVSYDHGGNASRGVAVIVPPSVLLRSPRDGAVVHTGPLLVWRAVAKATYYNVQLYHAGRKILSAWPSSSRLRLGRGWLYSGRRFQLEKGSYKWYVWPAFPVRPKTRYGRLLGQGNFTVR